jgi:hypothetical protein
LIAQTQIVTNSFAIASANSKELTLSWKGATDAGSGICQVNVVDEDGLVLASSAAKNAPAFKVAPGTTLAGTAQVFDCLGNGLTGSVSIANTYIPADKSSRTGKWSVAGGTFGTGALKCAGKCTASISTKGKFEVLLGAGAATVSVGNKTVASISENKSKSLTMSATIDVGSSKKVVRITGNNFVLVGLASVTTSVGALKELDRLPAITDPSLTDAKQVALAKLGFRASDFSQEWTSPANGQWNNFARSITGSLQWDIPFIEKDRVERRQVAATKVGSTFSFLSTEVVKYSSAAAASDAQKELVKVLAQCQSDKGYKDSTGTLVPYEFKKLPPIPAGVVSEGNRVFVHAIIDADVRARTLLGFYQFNGDTFTGLYVLNSEGFTDAQVAKWLKVAVTMADRLNKK